ncbi:S-layer homology domain-containing protein [Paenibacillus sp. FSL H8-0034]|uniref:S-layer homology domain-containing protein n=1 Tax=Paenibacillus sp. FSL H8-0034 TaxID=2954671 RepID=UPI0030F4DD3E
MERLLVVDHSSIWRKISSWAQNAVAQSVHASIVSGYEYGIFRPDAEIIRQEMAVMIARAMGSQFRRRRQRALQTTRTFRNGRNSQWEP